MTTLPTTASLGLGPTWDGDRRVAGGALAGDPPALEGKDELTFADFLSVINPLQHIPVVSTLYRWVTGDTIKPAARVVGGALYGGPVGLVTAALNAIVEQVKGSDIGAQVLAAVVPDTKPDADTVAPTAVAAAPAQEREAAVSQDDSNAAALLQLAADLRAAAPAEEQPPTPPPAPLLPGQARTLAFYQANAGQRIAAVDSGRGGAGTKYSLPVATHSALTARPLPIAATDDKPAAPAVAQDGPPGAWFASAMLRGLDRYRASAQLNKAPSQVDLSE